jgi:hypothetical protein
MIKTIVQGHGYEMHQCDFRLFVWFVTQFMKFKYKILIKTNNNKPK